MKTCWTRFVASFICISTMCGTYAYTEESCNQVDGKPRDCMKISECPSILQQIIKPVKTVSTDMLRELNCGYDKKMPKVCCPRKQHRNLHLLPQQCGEFDSTKNLDGEYADLNEFPWIALLSYRIGNRKKFACGGSLINKNYVLTAAQCISADLLGVRIGEYYIARKKDCVNYLGEERCTEDVQDFSIEYTVAHDSFERETLSNDIGLIRLRGTVTTRANAKPICLPVTPDTKELNLASLLGTVAGWGVTEDGNESDVLRKVIVPIVSNQNCSTESRYLNTKKLCAGDLERESCKGDKGGPLISLQLMEEKVSYVQFGIVSYGTSRTCGEDKHGVYTRVTEYTNWILDNLEP